MAIQPFTPSQFNTQQQESVQPKRQRGTGFTNIGRLLGANIGAGQQMGQRIGQTIGSKAGEIGTGVGESFKQFQAGRETGLAGAKKKIEEIGSYGSQIGEGGEVSGGISGLTEEQAKKAGEEFASAKYTGPTELAGGFGKKAAALKELGQGALGSQRSILGSTLAQKGPYTKGQSLLDVSLLGQSKEAQQAIRGSALEAMRAATQAQQKEQIAKNLAQSAKELVGGDQEKGALREEAEKKLLTGESAIQEAAKKQAEQYYKEAGTVQNLMNKITSGTITDYSELSQDELQALDKLGTYGLTNIEQIAALDPNQLKSVFNTLSQGYANQPGISKFLNGQQEALRNLALLRGQKELAKTVSEMKEAPEAFNIEKIKEAQKQTGGYVTEAGKRQQALAKNINVGNFITEIQKDQGTAARKLGIPLPFGFSKGDYDYVNFENRLVDAALQNLDPEELGKVRQWQASPGRTVGQLADLLTGSSGEYKEIQQRLGKLQTPSQNLLRQAILSQLAGAPVEPPTQQLENKYKYI